MAVLDRRLLPLIETLTTAGADWLAFELLDGIRRGRETEESLDMLAAARDRARRGGDREAAKSQPLPPPPRPLIEDDQVRWAAAYVVNRLDDAVASLSKAVGNLGEICARTPRSRRRDIGAADKSAVFLVLGEGELATKVDAASLARAADAIPRLRAAVERWAGGLLDSERALDS